MTCWQALGGLFTNENSAMVATFAAVEHLLKRNESKFLRLNRRPAFSASADGASQRLFRPHFLGRSAEQVDIAAQSQGKANCR
jgi:hypothetical protein